MDSETAQSRSVQRSEAFLTVAFLSLSGGLQDAYTYMDRGGVFANAQTGNIVLLSVNLLEGNWGKVLHYLIPLLFFALGVAAAVWIRSRFRHAGRIHWRQLVVAAEILLLFLVGLLPDSAALWANALVSFSCAMQVQSFRKVDGFAFASTMCIGDLRSGMEALCTLGATHDRAYRRKAVRYFSVILLFALGAGAGGLGVALLGHRTVWLSCGLLVVCFGLMCKKP